MERTEFAATRKTDLDTAEGFLGPAVEEALGKWGDAHWYEPLVQAAEDLYDRSYQRDSGHKGGIEGRDVLAKALAKALERTKEPRKYSAEMLARYIATAVTNAAQEQAAADDTEELVLEWVTMHDQKVRHTHRLLDGQTRKPGERFKVGDVELAYPGDTSAPIEEWINCRCVLRPDKPEALTASAGFSPAKPTHAGLAVVARDTGRVLMLQRTMDPEDPCAGMWEFPGGHIEDGETPVQGANREWCEETGLQLPDDAEEGPTWDSEDGVYRGHVIFVNNETDLSINPAHEERIVQNPDDPNGDATEVTAWFTPSDLPSMPALRPEVLNTPWELLSADPAAQEDDMTEPDEQAQAASKPDTIAMPDPIPWHGVLTAEGIPSGDKRSFSKGALRARPLPLPLTWQKVKAEGHDGNVITARIDRLGRIPGEGDAPDQIIGTGFFRQSPEADEQLGLMADFGGRMGVSVDLDDSTMEFSEEEESVNFTSARVCSACVLGIPAFAEAWVAIGEPPAEWEEHLNNGSVEGAMPAPEAPAEPVEEGETVEAAVSDKAWDGSASRFTPEQWKASCIVHLSDSDDKSDHKLPIKEPNGDLSRSGVHAAAARINQTDAPAEKISAAKSALRSAYKTLGEEPPDTLSLGPVGEELVAAGLYDMGRGPGWVTDPKATNRLHTYWTEPGQPGYEKIGWGTGGDFNRCRVEVGEEIGENSPDKLRFINQICAQWHKDALGYWPSTHAKMLGHAIQSPNLVASAGTASEWTPRAEWFADLQLDQLTRTTFVEHPDGTEVYGHFAEKNTCHLAFEGVCIAMPTGLQYDYFHSVGGGVLTDQGLIDVGCLTLGGGHADTRLGVRAALAHYDDVSSVVAYVRVGEDQFGGWFHGWLLPSASEEQKVKLRAAKLSGDWRDVGGRQELLLVHAVNVGGFTLNPQTSVIGGRQIGLVAAGVLPEEAPMGDAKQDLAEIVAAGIRTYEQQRQTRERLNAIVSQAGADPKARIERLKATVN